MPSKQVLITFWLDMTAPIWVSFGLCGDRRTRRYQSATAGQVVTGPETRNGGHARQLTVGEPLSDESR